MDLFVLAAAALVFGSILLTPISSRVGAPLLLLFLLVGMIVVICSLILQGWTIPVVARWLGLAADRMHSEARRLAAYHRARPQAHRY